MNQTKPYILSLLMAASTLFFHSSLAQPVQAGGPGASYGTELTNDHSDYAEPPDYFSSDPTGLAKPDANSKRKPQIRTFDWKHWSRPYVQGNQHCRQRSGDIVCLTSESVKKMRW